MKKFNILLSLLMILSLTVACGNSNIDDSNTNTDSVQTTIQEDTSSNQTTEVSSQNAEIQDTSISTENQAIDLNAIVNEVTSKVEWAVLDTIDDASIINEFFTLDAENSNYNQLLVMQCPMSAVIAEIILIDANDVDSAIQDLNARRDKLINTDAYYPEHKEIAEQSIIGNKGNIVYFIASQNAQDSEKILLEYLNSLE